MFTSRRFRLDRLKMLALLDELETADGEVISLFVPPEVPQPEIEKLIDKVPGIETVGPDMVRLIASSPTGAVLFWVPSGKYLILPPFPVMESYITSGYDAEPLRSVISQDFTIALVLVRLGAYSIGVCQGEKLIVSKTGTGLIHARHKKGGSSQRRFERRREEQVRNFLERVCSHARQQLEPYASALDYLVYGGSRVAILSLQKQCPFLSQFNSRTLPPLLNIAEPRKAVLEAAIGDIWSSSVIEWYDEEGPGIDRQRAEV